ncbi:3-oxoacyl-ACP reductase FabG [Nocardioides massiliensis]|uniref:3-oxoacyl-ACP reductase FabG n=1 Tax=Nocardioides massiliensis TaxID=1325935 RepID=UPI00082AF758|nr:3-oxoacyl-ACP reductase FabG [Nocardioides massiliensis]
MSLLAGKVALVTGAAQGIGRATAECLAESGARVLVADIDGEEAQAAADVINAKHAADTALGLAVDVRSQVDAEAAVGAAVEQWGSLDVVVNNAGITRDATLRHMTLEAWQAVFEVNLHGMMLVTQAAAAVMREQGSGSIVNISSISGKVGLVGQTNYSAAKAGVVGFTKAAAKELAHRGVRVNSVQPGLVDTPMTSGLRDDILQQKLAEVPLGRAADPREVATVVLFLASDLSSYMTGAVLEVTGGRFM